MHWRNGNESFHTLMWPERVWYIITFKKGIYEYKIPFHSCYYNIYNSWSIAAAECHLVQNQGYAGIWLWRISATFIQAVLIIFTQGSSITLLKENCFSLVSAGSSSSNQSANKVWSLSSVIWPTSSIYSTKSGAGEAAGAASQTGLPLGALCWGINSK